MNYSLYRHVTRLMGSEVCSTVEKEHLPAGLEYIERDVGGVFVKFSDPIDLHKMFHAAADLKYSVDLHPDSSSPTKLFVGFKDVDYGAEGVVHRSPKECFSRSSREYFIPRKNSAVLRILDAYHSRLIKSRPGAGITQKKKYSGPDGI